MAFFKVSYNRIMENGSIRNAMIAVDADNNIAAKLKAAIKLDTEMGIKHFEITNATPFNNAALPAVDPKQTDIEDKTGKPKNK